MYRNKHIHINLGIFYGTLENFECTGTPVYLNE